MSYSIAENTAQKTVYMSFENLTGKAYFKDKGTTLSSGSMSTHGKPNTKIMKMNGLCRPLNFCVLFSLCRIACDQFYFTHKKSIFFSTKESLFDDRQEKN